jgi:MFS family permease
MERCRIDGALRQHADRGGVYARQLIDADSPRPPGDGRMAGQAISISGLFAVVASLLIATVAGRYNRRHVLLGLTGVMLASLILIAVAPNFLVLMIARALLGVVVGGFWSLPRRR